MDVKIQILYKLLLWWAFISETPLILRMFHDYIVKKIRYIKIYRLLRQNRYESIVSSLIQKCVVYPSPSWLDPPPPLHLWPVHLRLEVVKISQEVTYYRYIFSRWKSAWLSYEVSFISALWMVSLESWTRLHPNY